MWWFSSFESASVPAAHDTTRHAHTKCGCYWITSLSGQELFSQLSKLNTEKYNKNTVPEGGTELRDLSNLKLQWRQNEHNRAWISPLASSKHISLIGRVRKWWQEIKLCQRVLTSFCFCCCCQRRQIRLVLPSCCKSSGVRAAKRKKKQTTTAGASRGFRRLPWQWN